MTDTVSYHYLSWRQLAEELNIPFTKKDNEKLLGLSRPDSLKIFLKGRPVSDSEFEQLLQKKNDYFLKLLQDFSPANLLPGVLNLLTTLKESGFLLAVASSSRNTPVILERLKIRHYFAAVSDSNTIVNAKPAPDLFLDAAKRLSVEPKACVVVEDSAAGIEAGLRAQMLVVGIGPEELVGKAHLRYDSMSEINLAEILAFQRV